MSLARASSLGHCHIIAKKLKQCHKTEIKGTGINEMITYGHELKIHIVRHKLMHGLLQLLPRLA